MCTLCPYLHINVKRPKIAGEVKPIHETDKLYSSIWASFTNAAELGKGA